MILLCVQADKPENTCVCGPMIPIHTRCNDGIGDVNGMVTYSTAVCDTSLKDSGRHCCNHVQLELKQVLKKSTQKKKSKCK